MSSAALPLRLISAQSSDAIHPPRKPFACSLRAPADLSAVSAERFAAAEASAALLEVPPFDYMCLSSPEAARVFARSWRRTLASLLPLLAAGAESQPAATPLAPASPLAPPSSPSVVFRACARSLPAGSIVCVGEGTRRAAEEALLEEFVRMCGLQADPRGGEAETREPEASAHCGPDKGPAEGDDGAGHPAAGERREPPQGVGPTRKCEGGRNAPAVHESDEEKKRALDAVRAFFSSFSPSTATAASLAAELPPRPPLFSLLSEDSRACSGAPSPASGSETLAGADLQRAASRGCLGHLTPGCAYTPHQRLRIAGGPLTFCPCRLQTRVLWPTSALAAEGLSRSLERRKLEELEAGLSEKNVSLSCPESGGADAEGSCRGSVDLPPELAGGATLASASDNQGSLSSLREAAQREQTDAQVAKATRREGDACEAGEAAEASAQQAEVLWPSLPLFQVNRLNVYTTVQRMLSLGDREALLDALKVTVGEEVAESRASGDTPAGATRCAAATCEDAEAEENGEAEEAETERVTSPESVATSETYGEQREAWASSAADSAAAEAPQGRAGAAGREAQRKRREEELERDRACGGETHLACIMFGSPSAVWSWVANGLPLSHASLSAPVIPSYTAIHAGAKQLTLDSLQAEPGARAFSASEEASTEPGGSQSARRGDKRVASTEADFLKLLEACKNSLLEGREVAQRRQGEAQRLIAVAIGPTTAAAARQAGFAKVVSASRPGVSGWAGALLQAVSDHRRLKEVRGPWGAACEGREGEAKAEKTANEYRAGRRSDDSADGGVASFAGNVRVLVVLTREEGKNMELVSALEATEGVTLEFASLSSASVEASDRRPPTEDRPRNLSLSGAFSPNPAPLGPGARRGGAGPGQESVLEEQQPRLQSEDRETLGGEKKGADGGKENVEGGSDKKTVALKVLEVPLLRTESTRGIFKRAQSVLEAYVAANAFSQVVSAKPA
ncbi:hypothetical protein BESB_000050 [Besnoitia besnoiti]|uniref:Uroporphyrinogen-III synthase n=1 Tax=Besnoitia besnoiti TaxID=94643 RepID=A0A2A9MNV7_BESBE|nr:hypothetical protein BESB_000050 [Besnoitia besnoiti]PFH37663.1 hypothetical protein BESB_000050 [Besnoitia besnoiti]